MRNNKLYQNISTGHTGPLCTHSPATYVAHLIEVRKVPFLKRFKKQLKQAAMFSAFMFVWWFVILWVAASKL